MKKLDIAALNKLYREAEEADREVFAEMRSNVLLVAGEHYAKKNSSFDRRVRTASDLSETQKLRLTKNHIHKVSRHYVTSILSHAPGVTIGPANEKEIQDQKSAELNKSVWEHAKNSYRLKEKIREWANDFINVGEVAVKLFWDPNAGELKDYEPELDETGQPVVGGDGQPTKDTSKPIFTGAFVFERIFGFNLLRHAASQSMRDPTKPWIIRKMVDRSILEDAYKGDSEKLRMVTSGRGEEFVVFDANKASYERQRDQVLIREFYYPRSVEYPNGWYCITTDAGILEEGELPYGFFPIVWNGCDEFQSSPRRRSVIKVARPYQAEINRASSQMAMAQVTIGDDKILYQKGTKLEQGSLLPGVRGVSYQGAAPTVLPGRDGGQFLPYIESQVEEMYSVLMMDEINQEKDVQLDPWALVHRSIQQQQKFSLYSENFETFLVDLCTLYLELAKRYLPDDCVIPLIGRSEMVNLSEFRNTSPLCYQVTVEPLSDTVETQLGKQLAMQHVLQYVGNQLGKEDIGRIMRAMPYGNSEEAFGDFTLDYDNAKNDILALDRGDYPAPNALDNHDYLLKRLINRMKQADYKFLSPEIQANYEKKKQEHEQIMAQQAAALAAAKSETIPTGGAMIACDMYVPNEEDPSKLPKRVRVPYQALDWLVQKLEAQGNTLQKLEAQNQGALSEMAGMIMSQHGPSQGSAFPSQQPQLGQAGPGALQ